MEIEVKVENKTAKFRILWDTFHMVLTHFLLLEEKLRIKVPLKFLLFFANWGLLA